MAETEQIARLRSRFTEALKAGDRAEASRVVQDALEGGSEPAAIYSGVLAPALVEIGRAWVRGDLNIAAEHLATNISLQQIAYVRDAAQPKQAIKATATVAAIEGEMHALGAQMIANLFQLDGWEVTLLGQDTPTDALVEWVETRKPDLVILSLALPERMPVAIQAATMLKSLDDAPLVFVGGAGLSEHDESEPIPADLIGSDPLEAIRVARELLGIERERRTLEDHLRGFGRRVQALRKERGWSQQRLANQAGLDRAYLSTVEQGKQNITIGTAVAIADALESSLSELTDEGRIRPTDGERR